MQTKEKTQATQDPRSGNGRRRVFSGIQPSGNFHLGNYLGALKKFVDLQEEGWDAVYAVVDLHAITMPVEKGALVSQTRLIAAAFLACGVDPKKSILYAQSSVKAHVELAWIFNCVARMGWVERMTQFKDKAGKDAERASVGLFTYPVLMAADILAYDSDVVPVGEDQRQHIEVCRDLAASFNHHFGETFVMPKAKILDNTAKVPGTDGEKMSKSYNNTLEVFEEPKALRKKIMRIKTDSRPMEEAKDPLTDHLFQLFALVAKDSEREEMAGLYRQGGFGYGDVKKALATAAETYFADARARRKQLEADPDQVRSILKKNAQTVLRRGAC